MKYLNAIVLVSLATCCFALAMMNVMFDSTSENIMQQIVYAVRSYGAATCGSVFLAAAGICLSIAK